MVRTGALAGVAGVLGVVLITTSCATPQSAVFGQTALTGMGRGTMAVAVSPGFLYQHAVEPTETQSDGTDMTSSSSISTLGSVEGNLIAGLSDRLGLNLHVGPAGIQPGLKVLLLHRWVSLAVLPEFSILYSSYSAGTKSEKAGVTKTASDDYRRFGITVGAKAIASTAVGVYGGLGYSFQYLDYAGQTGDTSLPNYVLHTLGIALGYEFNLRGLFLRPELAFTITPAITASTKSGGVTTSESGGHGFSVFPNVSLALEARRPTAK